ncbi:MULTISPECIES: glutamate-5-semialdehyde dehydrogenase [unclassified Dehalobacter]|uniref:glutamate-5-semialdehyde dehydrogenase n=1 Tax=unclassified Dehalobacter TaxID=2635733 RepID=UPI000E6D23BF|nr:MULTISPECIES: glutamate-5-semialdehyde dehydrogenase [unclassified Dehalobacter]RJE46792.1 glutamate-5-semialdehyde dehydrogenase [Dehalobacter sp. MCB1]TCX49248.1 glutamate-5-semialdehyde dehydrogenase [Dehalobacter sp. 14DCB1]TCX49828.1 glutamate-5-semialdehyde dehydrogenase [Dehalobacter sp. 12DCB1]
MEFAEDLVMIGQRAKNAARKLAFTGTETKNKALLAMAQALLDNEDAILEANALDVAAAEKKGLKKSLINRLRLTSAGISDISNAIKEVVGLPDPVGGGELWKRPNGLVIQKTMVPLGVVAMIYEARPNVTVDAAALCLKSGNACILRGGSEAIESNKVLARVIAEAAEQSGIQEGAIQLIQKTDREYALQLMRMNKYIDVIIPRGGAGLIQTVVENSTVPVIETGTGVCHAYVDLDADYEKAVSVVFNAKTQKPGVCNALETLLVHEAVAEEYLPMIGRKFKAYGVEIRGCERVRKILDYAVPATEKDWSTEYLDLIISVKVVNSIDEALDHIYTYSTKHSETIITENYTASQRFLNEIDAAAVYVNASTRFTDGGRFGFGAEIGISTQKLHARGPMALPELTTIKYIVYGNGHIVE